MTLATARGTEPIQLVNDYLTNLAARSLNLAPTLQPRLRSRFEPASLEAAKPLVAMPGGPAPDVKTADVESAPADVTSRGVPGRRASASIAPASRETTTPRSSENIEASPDADSIMEMSGQPQLTIRPTEPISRFQPANHAVADPGATLDRPLPATVESKRTETAVQPSQQKNGEESPRSLRERLPQAVIREQVVIDEVLRRSEPERRFPGTPVAEAESPSREPERPATSSPIIAQPRVTPLFEDRSDERIGRGDEKAAAPAPTIHVTIGRVEVRATQSTSTSSPKPRPSRPAMSLDDYLRRRGDGGSR